MCKEPGKLKCPQPSCFEDCHLPPEGVQGLPINKYAIKLLAIKNTVPVCEQHDKPQEFCYVSQDKKSILPICDACIDKQKLDANSVNKLENVLEKAASHLDGKLKAIEEQMNIVDLYNASLENVKQEIEGKYDKSCTEIEKEREKIILTVNNKADGLKDKLNSSKQDVMHQIEETSREVLLYKQKLESFRQEIICYQKHPDSRICIISCGAIDDKFYKCKKHIYLIKLSENTLLLTL